MSFLNYEGLRAFINKIKQLFVPRIEALEQTAKDYLTFANITATWPKYNSLYNPETDIAYNLNALVRIGVKNIPPTSYAKLNVPQNIHPYAQLTVIGYHHSGSNDTLIQYVRDSFGSSASRLVKKVNGVNAFGPWDNMIGTVPVNV